MASDVPAVARPIPSAHRSHAPAAGAVRRLSRLAVTFFYKDELQLGPTEIGLLSAVGSAPWLVKPLWRAPSQPALRACAFRR